jgi:hypothetical protein
VNSDTPPDVETELAALFARLSPGERIKMACEMFDASRALMTATIVGERPDIAPDQLRERIRQLTYPNESDGG